MPKNYFHTGIKQCFDEQGFEITCDQSPQDAFFCSGLSWPEPRFKVENENTVQDLLTDITWTAKANFFNFPLTWPEALEAVSALNREGFAGHSDWRLPNRRELRSLVSHGARKPALPPGHPFTDVFLGWYWTSTTAAISPAHAWYIHFEGGRMFYGNKAQRYLVWPARGNPRHVPATGQHGCYDLQGKNISCRGSGQDGEFKLGHPWPRPRFKKNKGLITDQLTDLVWLNPAEIKKEPVSWIQALEIVRELDSGRHWRLPNINELESLVDASAHSPALPAEHPFSGLEDGYWSSTTSFFEPDWAYVLYLDKGAVGVGFKPGTDFFVWPVCDRS